MFLGCDGTCRANAASSSTCLGINPSGCLCQWQVDLKGEAAMRADDIEFDWEWDTAPGQLGDFVKDGQTAARTLVLLPEGLILGSLHSLKATLRDVSSNTSKTLSTEVAVHLAPYVEDADPATAEVRTALSGYLWSKHKKTSHLHANICSLRLRLHFASDNAMVRCARFMIR